MLTALAALEGADPPQLQRLHDAATVEAALAELQAENPELAGRLLRRIATAVEARSMAYLAHHGQNGISAGAVLFDRSRRVCALGSEGEALFRLFGGSF